MRNPRSAGKAIMEICRRLYGRGFVAATEGNVSVRLASGDILITGTRVRKREISSRDLVQLTPGGVRVSGDSLPSSEAELHGLIYTKRADIHAVVHAHPPFCTAFAVARKPLPVNVIPEVLVEFGDIPLVPFTAPSAGKLSRVIGPFLITSNFFLLANHGVVACAADLEGAYDLVERAEHAARIILLAGMLGGAKKLSPRERAEVLRMNHTHIGGQSRGRTKR